MSQPLPPAPVDDLFVSYADADRAWVEGYLLDALDQAGVRYQSEATFALGVPRIVEFERAVRSCRRVLLVVSPAYLADDFSQFANLIAQQFGLEQTSWPVIPLIIKPTPLPQRLAILVSLDATEPTRWAAVIQRLCAELRVAPPPPSVRPPCPYPGLRPYSGEFARLFYGRDAEIAELRLRLRHQRQIYVIGPSGSGKSSLVLVGLAQALAQAEPVGWLVASFRPGPQPVARLSDALGTPITAPATVASAVLGRLAQAAPTTRLLVIVDQLEELFTLADRAAQMAFIDVLQALRECERCAVILTMRADFYPDLINSQLWPLTAGQRLEIAPLRGEALRAALVQPAEAVGVRLEPELVERLLTDAAAEPGALPLLQETMVLLWERLERRLLPLAAYEALGRGSGLAVALATTADAALSALPPPQQTLARRILLALVQLGEGRADTRRQQSVADLRAIAGSDEPARFDATLRHLADRRLLTLSAGEAAGGQSGDAQRLVDLAHEALIGAWPQLQAWLSDREGLRVQRHLGEAAAAWQATVEAGQPDESLLYGGNRLLAAQQLLATGRQPLSTTEQRFLSASVAQVAARERSRYLGQAAGGAVGSALGYGLAFAVGTMSVRLAGGAAAGINPLIVFLTVFPVGQVVGFSIGLALWWGHQRSVVERAVLAGVAGGIVGSVAYVVFLQLVGLMGRTPPALVVLVGALFGIGIGVGSGLFEERWRRVAATTAGGVAGALLSVISQGLAWSLPATLIAGALLGLATGLGFQATAVERGERR